MSASDESDCVQRLRKLLMSACNYCLLLFTDWLTYSVAAACCCCWGWWWRLRGTLDSEP